MEEHERRRQRVTLGDLARSLGVSKTTVSNAFSRPDQLSAELRTRILDAARAAGYGGPDPVARMLRTRRFGAIGLILPESLPFALDDPTSSALLRGIADACEERRLGLLVVAGALHAQDPRTISEVAVDGFIAYSLPRGTAALETACQRGVPVVIVDEPRLPGRPTVAVDDRGGALAAGRHLTALGHRRIAIVSLPLLADGYNGPTTAARVDGATFDVAAARLAGYRDALSEGGIDVGSVPVFECAHSDEALGERAGRVLLEAPEPPSAILGMSDRLAIGVLAAARAVGREVPRELSVVGFDDVEAAAHVRPALTTVRQPLRLKGYAAARLLLDAPERAERAGDHAPEADRWPARPPGDATSPGSLDLPLELVVRRSTAPPGAR